MFLDTGSSSGIGFDTALVLAEAGWSVVATMRNLDKRLALGFLRNFLRPGVDG